MLGFYIGYRKGKVVNIYLGRGRIFIVNKQEEYRVLVFLVVRKEKEQIKDFYKIKVFIVWMICNW